MPIRKTETGRYTVEVCIARRRVFRRLPEGATARDAKQLEAELIKRLGKKVVASSDPFLPDLVADYATYVASQKRGWEKTKWAAYRLGPWITGKRFSELRQVVAKIREDMSGQYAPATINKSLVILAAAVSYAHQKGVIEENPRGLVQKLPENNARERVLTLDEVKALANAASPAVRAAIYIALYTGMRRGEIAALEQKHIDFASDVITIPSAMAKTDKMRVIPIVAPARPWLEQIPLGITAQGIHSGIRRARQAAGIEHATLHDLRRTCGTMLVRAGVDLYTVSKILGHSSTAITQQRYAHLIVDQLKEGMGKAFG